MAPASSKSLLVMVPVGLASVTSWDLMCAGHCVRHKSGGGQPGGGVSRQPHSTGAGLCCVASADVGRRVGNNLGQAGGAGGDVLCQLPKIFDLIPGVLVETDAAAIGVPEGALEMRDESPAARNGQDHDP